MQKLFLLFLLAFSISINAENSGQEIKRSVRVGGIIDCRPVDLIKKWCLKVIKNQTVLLEQIKNTQQYQKLLIVPQIRDNYARHITQRYDALIGITNTDIDDSTQVYNVPMELKEYLYEQHMTVDEDDGTEFTHTLHFEALCVANELMKVQEYNRIMPRVNEFAKIAIGYNRIGHGDVAMMLLDFCWAVLDAVTCMKMKIERQDNQDPIAMHLARIIFGHYGVRVKPIKKMNNEAELVRAKLAMMHDIITEKLNTIPTRNLVQTDAFANEYQLMSRVLQEVDLFYEMIMRSMGFEK